MEKNELFANCLRHRLLHRNRPHRAIVPLHRNLVGALPAYDGAARNGPVVGAAGYGIYRIGLDSIAAKRVVAANNRCGISTKISHQISVGRNIERI